MENHSWKLLRFFCHLNHRFRLTFTFCILTVHNHLIWSICLCNVPTNVFAVVYLAEDALCGIRRIDVGFFWWLLMGLLLMKRLRSIVDVYDKQIANHLSLHDFSCRPICYLHFQFFILMTDYSVWSALIQGRNLSILQIIIDHMCPFVWKIWQVSHNLRALFPSISPPSRWIMICWLRKLIKFFFLLSWINQITFKPSFQFSLFFFY